MTIDTNCINVRGRHPALNGLEELAREGRIEITGTRVLAEELAMDGTSLGGSRRSKARKLRIGNSGFVVGRSRVGGPDVLGGPGIYRYLDPIARLIKNRDWTDLDEHTKRDVMHLAIHRAHRWEIFVTMDRAILAKATILLSAMDLRVMAPEEAAKTLAENASHEPPN